MAWDAINLRTERGLTITDADRDVILDVAEKAILGSDQDPAVVIQAAKRVGRKLDVIQNLRAYATRAIKTALNRASRDQDLKDRPVCQRDMDGLADLKQRDQIENQVLVRELLEVLSAQDREIFLRKVAGETCNEIDRDMNLTPRTAETRFRASKARLRQLLTDKLGEQTRSRGR